MPTEIDKIIKKLKLLSEVAYRNEYSEATEEGARAAIQELSRDIDINWKKEYGLSFGYFPKRDTLSKKQMVLLIEALKEFFDAIMVQCCFEEDFAIEIRYPHMCYMFDIEVFRVSGFYTRVSFCTDESEDFLSDTICRFAELSENSNIDKKISNIEISYFPHFREGERMHFVE